jgi:hypothetical protein
VEKQVKEQPYKTVARTAEILGTKRRNITNYIDTGLFPNAIRLSELVDGVQGITDPWLIPVGDIKDFKFPVSGRKKGSKNGSKAAA